MSNTSSQNVTEQTPENNNTPKPKRRFWRKVRMSVLAFLVLFVVFFVWLISTNSGLRFAVLQLPKLGKTHITTRTLSGSILSGFQGDSIRVENEAVNLDISEVAFAWQARELWQRHLHINEIRVGDMLIESKDTPPKEHPPLKQPKSLKLPLYISVDKIKVGSIQLASQKPNQTPTEILDSIQAAFNYNLQRYQLRLLSVQNSWSNSEGTVTLHSDTPFALQGKISSKGMLDDVAIDNALTLSGSLNDVKLNGTLTGKSISLNADAQFRPFAPLLNEKIDHILFTGSNINPRAFNPKLPKAQLTFNIHAKPELMDNQNQLSGSIDVLNTRPQWFDQQSIAIKTIQGQFVIDDHNIAHLQPLDIALMQQGKVLTNGEINIGKQTLNLKTQVKQLTSQDLISRKIIGEVNGDVLTKNTFQQPQISWLLNTGRANVSGSLDIYTDTKNQQRTLLLKNGKILPQNGGEMLVSGSYELFQNQKITAKINSKQFNPAKLYPDFPDGSVNGEITLDALAALQQYRANIQFSPSQLSGASLSGSGKIVYENGHLSQADNNIILGANTLRSKGAFGKKGDTLALDINAPELNRFGFGIQGALQAKGTLTSIADSFTQLDAKLSGNAQQFAFNQLVKINQLDFNVLASPDPNRPLNINAKGKGIQISGSDIDQLDAVLAGTLRQHSLNATSSLKVDNKPLSIQANAQGGLNDQQQWQGQVSTLNLAGALDLKLLTPFRLEAGAKRVALTASRWQALLGNLSLEHLIWDKQNGLTSKGRADNLHLEQLHNFYQPPIKHDLVLSGDWDLRYNQSPSGYLNVYQQSGDIVLPDERKTTLLLKQLVLNSQLNSNGITNKISGQTRYGKVSGNVNILQTFGKPFAQAPLSGQISVVSENLDTLRSFLPIGQTLSGQLNGDIKLSGRLNDPQLSGSITGEQLNYRHREIGIVLADGTLRSHLDGQKWVVDALTFKRKNGTVTLTGTAAYRNNNPDVQAQIRFNAYPILDQVNRYLAVSGQSDVTYTNNGMLLSGSLKTDEGRFGFQDSSAPSLSDDVVVLGEEKEVKTETMPFHLDLDFDLNDKFLFSGQGLNVTLGGKLNVKAKPNTPFTATGSVKVIDGRYKAYGQDLVIKKGIISFVGPLTNPNLNIRAERRASMVGAGVEVLGNLNQPRVNLVANEPMSEKDKLSWLILNRASSGSDTDEAALSAVAGAFLAGSINDKIGLVDDFGLTSQQTRNKQTGEMNPAQQVLTFGKQLTHNLYLGYEAGLETASQSVKLVYQLSRSFQAIVRAGTESSGGEIKYIKRFD